MSTQHAGTGEDDGITNLSQEIRLLVEMIVEHAMPWLESVVSAGHGSASGSTGEQGADRETGETTTTAAEEGSRDGGWCPLCAVVAIVRGERPELAARLAEQAARLVALLRAVLADRWYADSEGSTPGFGAGEEPFGQPSGDAVAGRAGRTGRRRVQHIPVRPRETGQGRA